MREARPDDPIFKTGFVIGEKRQRTSPQDMTGQREIRDEDEGKTPEQIDQEERLAWARRVYRQSNKKINPYRG
jgi:hypothetical protein